MPVSTQKVDNSALATSSAIQAGAHPDLLAAARSQLGKKAYIGFCEAFVEQATRGQRGMFPSAIAAWNGQQNVARPGTNGMQPGDIVYFNADPSNQNFGHTGIYAGNNQFISATNNGIQQTDLDAWQKSTGQKLLGYVPNPKQVPNAFSFEGEKGMANFSPADLQQQQAQQKEAMMQAYRQVQQDYLKKMVSASSEAVPPALISPTRASNIPLEQNATPVQQQTPSGMNLRTSPQLSRGTARSSILPYLTGGQ